MFALAIVLLIAAAALVLWVIFGLNDAGNNKIHFDGFGITADLSPLTLFLLGALALRHRAPRAAGAVGLASGMLLNPVLLALLLPAGAA